MLSKNSLVSIVIPSYNHAKFIEKTIDSVLNQTIDDLELIVIDDGSPDDSAEIIKKKLSTVSPQSKVKLIARENRGLCNTLNEGLKLARGNYFAYIGSDDFWEPEKLELQIKALENSGKRTAASYSDCFLADENDERCGRFGKIYKYRGGNIYDDLVWARYQPPSPTNLFRREALLSVDGFNENYLVEDRDLWIRIARIYDVAYIDKPLASFRYHKKNTTTVHPERMFKYARQIYDYVIKTDPSYTFYKKKLSAKVTAEEAAALYEAAKFDEARQRAIKSLVEHPFNQLAWRIFLPTLLGNKTILQLRELSRARFK
jgi:alpha-1,3-rhamnosyltransferase